jgi:hypothetical protein
LTVARGLLQLYRYYDQSFAHMNTLQIACDAALQVERAPTSGQQGPKPRRVPQNHRTVDRVTRILEEVVYKPGMTFAELARALDAPKSSVHGFLSGLLAQGWLYEMNHRSIWGQRSMASRSRAATSVPAP